MLLDQLTKREKQIIAELSTGERVSSLAEKLFISQHTVRNHLRHIFTKLNVRSQSELVGYVKEHPSELGLQLVETVQDNKYSQIAEFAEIADERVAKEIGAIFQDELNSDGLKKVMRTALPLDPLAEQEWKHRIHLMNGELESPDEIAQHIERVHTRRQRVNDNIVRAQTSGWVSKSKSPEELSDTLYSIVIGAAMQILRNPTTETIESQLTIIDSFVDSITQH